MRRQVYTWYFKRKNLLKFLFLWKIFVKLQFHRAQQENITRLIFMEITASPPVYISWRNTFQHENWGCFYKTIGVYAMVFMSGTNKHFLMQFPNKCTILELWLIFRTAYTFQSNIFSLVLQYFFLVFFFRATRLKAYFWNQLWCIIQYVKSGLPNGQCP